MDYLFTSIGGSSSITQGFDAALKLAEWLIKKGFTPTAIEKEDTCGSLQFEPGLIYIDSVETAKICLRPLRGQKETFRTIHSDDDGWRVFDTTPCAFTATMTERLLSTWMVR